MEWSRSIYGPLCILSLGSFFGNDKFHDAVARLSSWREFMRPDDRMLLGLDGRQDEAHLWNAYHQSNNLFERFLRNGLEYSNALLGCRWYYEDDWIVGGVLQKEPLMHRFQIMARKAVVCEELNLHFEAGEFLDCFEVFKYTPVAMKAQFDAAGFHVECMWTSPASPNSFRK